MATPSRGSASSTPVQNVGSSNQTRLWLDVNFGDIEQFTSSSLVCQYCFRAIALDKTIISLANDLRKRPLILSSTPLEPLFTGEASNTRIPDSNPRSANTTQKNRLKPTSDSGLSVAKSAEDDSASVESWSSSSRAKGFSAALPSPAPAPASMSPPVTKLLPNRKQMVNVTLPVFPLQIRRPKTKVNLVPPEPVFVESSQPPGSFKRPLSSASPVVSSSGYGSANGSTFQQYQQMLNASNAPSLNSMKPSPSADTLSTLLSSTNSSSTAPESAHLPAKNYFRAAGADESASTSLSDEPQLGTTTSSEGDLVVSDEQLLQELLFHTCAEYEMDLPLCDDCADTYMSQMMVQHEDADTEIEELERYLRTFPTHEQLEQFFSNHEASMEQTKQQSREKERALDRRFVEMALQDQALKRARERESDLKKLVDDYWTRYQRYKLEDVRQQEVYDGIKETLRKKTLHLERLRTSSSLNEVFHIAFDGHYATINGLRLGLRSPSLRTAVDWDELSAAFGFLSFMLIKLGIALGHNWKQARYALRLNGSFCTVLVRETGYEEALYLDKDSSWALLKFRDLSSFDRGFEVLILSVMEVFGLILSRDPEFTLPYPLRTEPTLSIGGTPIASSRSNPELWTRLAKRLAINFKMILQWLIAQSLVT